MKDFSFYVCFGWAIVLVPVFSGCQNPPKVASAAIVNSFDNAPPMESQTTNMELEKRRALLEDLLSGKISDADFEKARNAPDGKDGDERMLRLSQIIRLLELSESPKTLSAEEKDFLLGQFYFYERRFVESAKIFSRLLDKRPRWLPVRSLLARCFYFLGNTDRAFVELHYVVENHANQKEELLDALFLIGAIAMDSPSVTPEQRQRGVLAWKTYLKIAPNSPLKEKIESGLADSLAQKEGKTKANKPIDIREEALLAIEKDDILTAETKIREALKIHPSDEQLHVALARVYVKSGRVAEALSQFQEVFRKHPKSALGYLYQGMAFMMAGEPAKAVSSWENVLQLDVETAKKFNLEGRILIAKNMMNKGP